MFLKNSVDYITQNNFEPVLAKPSLKSKKGFHLQNNIESKTGENEYLAKYDFKQRIDSMFDETRSAILSSNEKHGEKYIRTAQSDCGVAPVFKPCENISPPDASYYGEDKLAKNTVQARIEKMFADVSSSDIEDEGSMQNVQQFQVDYIGSLPLPSKVTSLQGLQEPLKNLYFHYRQNKCQFSKLQALLEISSDGLKVQNFQKNNQHVKEQLNPFPSIAVWAALKFTCRPHNWNGKKSLQYAFLPLVVSHTNPKKSSLFRSLDETDISCAIERTYDDHSPLFVVIMRQSGALSSNRLECHAFACATCEDAIVLAADLYKALVAAMSNGPIHTGSVKKRKKIKCRNGLGTVCSIPELSVCEEQHYLYQEGYSKVPAANQEIVKKIPPPRPPRKNKALDGEENVQVPSRTKPDEIVVVDDMLKVNEPIETNDCQTSKKTGSLHSVNNCVDKVESGDILTKVVIPRSGSFLNASGPLNSRYNRCANNYTDRINCNDRKSSLHSPLGFIELFNELRIDEGLNNIDDILSTIVDVDGMSFNSLKPIYKEFIFKLAVTLTKDELYQRSKSIMQKQKRRRRQMMFNRRRSFVSAHTIKRIFHVPMSKLRPSKYKLSLPCSSYIFPALKKMQKNNRQLKPKAKLKRQNAASTLTSNDSFFLGFSRQRKNSFKYQSNDIYKNKSFYLKRGEILFHRKKLFSASQMQNTTFSSTNGIKNFAIGEENVSLLVNNHDKNGNQLNGQHFCGYITCSECSYNSESCKYRTFKKCYCSLNKQSRRNKSHRVCSAEHKSSVSSCSCDTDSCIESDKCYCNRTYKPSIFEQLKQQGFAASESSVSRPSSPITAWQTNEGLIPNANEEKMCLQASKSLEFFHVHKTVAKLAPNREESQITSAQNNIFEGHFQRFNCRSNNSQNRTCSENPILMTNNCDRISNLNKSNANNNTNTNESENSDTDDYTFNNCENRFKPRPQNCIEEDSDNLISSERFHLDGKHAENDHNKVLVVSMRDQKGQVKNSVAPLYNQNMFSSNIPLQFFRNDSIHENDAISIKKTAEIAALFSDMKVEKRNHINMRSNNDIIYNSLNPSTRNMCIKNINLENSLGYFP